MNVVERVVRPLDDFQQRHAPLSVGVGVIKKFGDDNAGALVSNLALAAFASLFPLLLLLVTTLGLVLAHDPSLRQSVLHSTFAEFPIIGRQLGSNIHALQRSSAIGMTIGIVGLLIGSLGLSQAGFFAMAEIWSLPGPARLTYAKRLGRSLAFLAVLGVGLVVSTTLAGFGTFGLHNFWLGLAGEVLAAMVNVGQYLLAFRVLTPGEIGWRQLLPGACVGGVAWTLLLGLGGYLVGHHLRNGSAVYGLFAIVLGLLSWVYLGAEISVYAAELNTVLARRLWPRTLMQPPLTAADQQSIALQARKNQRRSDQEIAVSFAEPPMTQRQYREGEHPRPDPH